MDNNQNVQDSKIAKPVSVLVKEGSQYPWNKQIPFVVTIKSNIVAGPVYVNASVNAGKFLPKQRIINHISNGVYKVRFKYIPTEQGNIRYTFTVSATTPSTNYADSFSSYLTINKNLVRTPITSGFLTYELAIGIGILMLIVFLLINLKKGLYHLKDSVIPNLVNKQVSKGL